MKSNYCFSGHHFGQQQGLALDCVSRQGGLHAFMDQAFMGGVLVDDDQPVGGLGDDIGVVQLRPRRAQGIVAHGTGLVALARRFLGGRGGGRHMVEWCLEGRGRFGEAARWGRGAISMVAAAVVAVFGGFLLFGLFAAGMYVYFAGRGILARLELQNRGHRVGDPAGVRVAMVALMVWGVAGLITAGASIITLA